MTWIHDQLFPTLIVLSGIQTWVFADIFHLRRKRREGESSERKQNEKLTSSASCSNNLSLWSAFSGVKLELLGTLWRSQVETHSGETELRGLERGELVVGCVILLSQSGVGWDQAWRLLDKRSSNTTWSFCTAAAHGGPRVWRCLRTPSVKTCRQRSKAVHFTRCRRAGYQQG